jgi:hypothetical protein
MLIQQMQLCLVFVIIIIFFSFELVTTSELRFAAKKKKVAARNAVNKMTHP